MHKHLYFLIIIIIVITYIYPHTTGQLGEIRLGLTQQPRLRG